jgi:hypothetical protein
VTSGTGADGNIDGVVDLADFEVWQNHFGDVRLAGFGEQTPNFGAAVPEPASLLMVAAGAAILAARARGCRIRRVR